MVESQRGARRESQHEGLRLLVNWFQAVSFVVGVRIALTIFVAAACAAPSLLVRRLWCGFSRNGG